MPSKSIDRRKFLLEFVKAGGVSYGQAAKIYDAMSQLFADAVVTGQRIGVGNVLAIQPVRRKARRVNMGFRQTKRTIHLSDRITFKVRVFRRFLDQHELNWTL